MRPLLAAALAGLVAGIAFGVWLGFLLWYTPQDSATTETYTPGYVQHDGSHVLERQPEASPPPPPHALPKGSRELARVHIQAKANQPATALPGASSPCSPVDIDLSLLRDSTGGTRVAASSPDGEILGGTHMPILDTLPEPTSWAIVTFKPQHDAYTALLGHDFHILGHPVGLGAGVDKPELGKPGPIIGLKFSF